MADGREPTRTKPTTGIDSVVLVLPGGTDSSYQPFRRTQPSALRMYPFTWSLRAATIGRAVVRQVEYRVYGWNGDQASPMPYARAALDRAKHDHPGAGIILVGHSMGGRVAAHLAADPAVTGVLALAPWWQFADWRAIHHGARVHAIHGTADTRTYAHRTERGITELRERGVPATYTPVPGGGHAMLDHVVQWQWDAIRFVNSVISSADAEAGADPDPDTPRTPAR